MIQLFKFCRITCDRCSDTSFEVNTFDDEIEAPEGWKLVSIYHMFAETTRLCCPPCVDDSKSFSSDPRDIKIASPIVQLKENF